MKAHHLRVLGTAVLLVILSATTVPAPIAAETRPAPMPFDCNTATGIPLIQCQALVALYNSTDGPNWGDKTDWLVTNTPCTWFGVTCSGGSVTELSLWGNHLYGSMPSDLGNLADLQRLDLFFNELSGSIPAELGNLTKLQLLDLSSNKLSGGIPAQLGTLASLQDLNLSSNDLSLTIPKELGNLANLEYLELHTNQLSGGIPPQLGNLAKLKLMDVSYNQLKGSLPQSLTNLNALSTFYYDTDLLCAPANAAFQAWLTGIPDRSTGGKICGFMYLPVVMR